jgi:phospholipid/cholesterol/gamma-HCH transport system substrate-binding protein
MRPARLLALLGVATLGLSSCGISLQSLPKIGGVSGPTYPLTATFANVVNLPANANVRVGAFKVGYVSSIGLRDFKALITMRIEKSVELPAGTTAAIHFDTPLGEDFVLLQPPSPSKPPYLKSGSSIPESETSTAPSVEDLFGALGALLNGGGIDQLQTIISQTDLAFAGNQAKIRALIQNLDSTVSYFSEHAPALDSALSAIASLARVLEQGSSTITQGIATIGPAVGVLAGESQQIDDLVTQLDSLSNAANAIIDASAAGTVQTVQQLQPLLTQLTSVQAQLGPALSAIGALEHNTPAAVPGDYVQLAINATIGIPPVPSDAPPLEKVTVDPPDPYQAYDQSATAMLMEAALP